MPEREPIEEDLISFETAKLAKEKGFNESCKMYYHNNIENNIVYSHNHDSNTSNSDREDYYTTPTQALLQKWLRKVHKIFVTALPFQDIEDQVELCWFYTLVHYDEDKSKESIHFNENDLSASGDNYDTYEQALEEGLIEGLKLIK